MILKGDILQKNPCKKVSIFEGMDIVKKLEQELKNSAVPGIGLAAPQIGIDAQVFILRFPKEDPYKDYTLDIINPEIKEQEDLRIFKDEGCLSYAGRRITTQRYNETYAVDALHPTGLILGGLWSVAFSHELDHLLGLTMYDREVKLGPNDRCFCNSGKKYKACHMNNIIK